MNVTVSTELAIPAERAYELAQRPATVQHVLWPWLTITPDTEVPERIVEGARISLHLRWLGWIPAWTHEIRIERFTPEEIVSHEYGGPIAVWNHRLTLRTDLPHKLSLHGCRPDTGTYARAHAPRGPFRGADVPLSPSALACARARTGPVAFAKVWRPTRPTPPRGWRPERSPKRSS